MGDNMLTAIKSSWKNLIWIWLLPLFLLGLPLLPGSAQHWRVLFYGIELPVFFGCFYIAAQPVRARKMTIGQAVVLIILVPIIVWVVLVLVLFGLAFVTDVKGFGNK